MRIRNWFKFLIHKENAGIYIKEYIRYYGTKYFTFSIMNKMCNFYDNVKLLFIVSKYYRLINKYYNNKAIIQIKGN